MKKFAPYLIKLDQDQTGRFIAAARKVLAHPWYHHRSKPRLEEFIHFRREAVLASPPVILSLVRDDSETLKVCNIIPKEGSLSLEQWRAILLDFESSVLHKIRARGLEFVTFMGSEHVNLAHMMHPFAWKLLQSLGRLGPKHQPGLHPFDRLHFLEFIAALHLTGHRLAPHYLGGYLREQGFTRELSGMLEDQFDYHLELLKIYDHIRKSKEDALAKLSQP